MTKPRLQVSQTQNLNEGNAVRCHRTLIEGSIGEGEGPLYPRPGVHFARKGGGNFKGDRKRDSKQKSQLACGERLSNKKITLLSIGPAMGDKPLWCGFTEASLLPRQSAGGLKESTQHNL